ncbi:MAG: hypothetical protein SFX18_00650 [Pirellulales bacterium]|nr:hypothetical protein [Pirellulales bacterium]
MPSTAALHEAPHKNPELAGDPSAGQATETSWEIADQGNTYAATTMPAAPHLNPLRPHQPRSQPQFDAAVLPASAQEPAAEISTPPPAAVNNPKTPYSPDPDTINPPLESIPYHTGGTAQMAPVGSMLVGNFPPGGANCPTCGPQGNISPNSCPADAGGVGSCDAFASSAACPLPQGLCQGPWKPDGLRCPWPADEYLCDGGDQLALARVQNDWTVQGLDAEDTVVHYDSEDGRVYVEPSNRVCIYAPRFAAVRRVDGLFAENQLVKAGGVDRPLGPELVNEKLLASTKVQPLAPVEDLGAKQTNIYEGQNHGIPLIGEQNPRSFQDRLKPAAAFDQLMAARLDDSLKPFLATKALDAIVWTADQAVQVEIDNVKAAADLATQAPQIVFEVCPGQPQIRLVKAASTNSAQPGEIVQFVLRYENVGQQTIGNVTIIDSLTTRLEYVPESQQSSREAKFLTQENAGESLVLRWEIAEPIKPGEGGVIVFKCKVR